VAGRGREARPRTPEEALGGGGGAGDVEARAGAWGVEMGGSYS
jgi:hypothetical protein